MKVTQVTVDDKGKTHLPIEHLTGNMNVAIYVKPVATNSFIVPDENLEDFMGHMEARFDVLYCEKPASGYLLCKPYKKWYAVIDSVTRAIVMFGSKETCLKEVNNQNFKTTEQEK